ncbi:5-methylcytosine rRNA methyltransferase NSUN4-like isoform X2 [Rhopilema esculentum]
MFRAEKCMQALTDCYLDIFGKNWWEILSHLKQEKWQCALLNKMSPECKQMEDLFEQLGAEKVHLHNFQREGENSVANLNDDISVYKFGSKIFDPPSMYLDSNGKMKYYLLDMSSMIPVLSLGIQPSELVLDMCAAPGGKSLAILMLMLGDWQLISNEYDKSRLKRLHKVLREYVPNRRLQKVKITNLNGIKFGEHEPNTFDRVLLDAPCSSDRHLIQDDFRMAGWSVKKSREFAKLQKELLVSALRTVKVGGVVVYSTCTLSQIENDDVISPGTQQAYERFGIKTKIVDLSSSVKAFGGNAFFLSQYAKLGCLVLPTPMQNWGPMYTSKLIKLSD